MFQSKEELTEMITTDSDRAPYEDMKRLKNVNLDVEDNQIEILSDRTSVLVEHAANYMNEVHDLNKSIRYWETILGDFIDRYLRVIVDRYNKFELLSTENREFMKVGLSTSSYQISQFQRQFFSKCKTDDLLNYQLLTQIAKFRGRVIDQRNAQELGMASDQGREYTREAERYSFTRVLKNGVKVLLNAAFDFESRGLCSQVSVYNTNIPVTDLLYLVLMTAGRVWPARLPDPEWEDSEVDWYRREKLREVDSGDHFSNMVLHTLAYNLPTCFLENFLPIKRSIEKQVGDRSWPRVIVFGWAKDAITKTWLAESADRGATIVGVQLGGLYGEGFYAGEENVRRIADRFITWGWKDEERDIPLPSLRLPSRTEIDPGSTSDSILWVGKAPKFTTHPNRYGLGSEASRRVGPSEYEERQARFYEALPDELKSTLIIRPKPNGMSASMRRYLRDRFPSAEIDDLSREFVMRAREARLLVIDHFGATTFLEALAMGKPVVVFSDLRGSEKSIFPMSEIAIPYYEELHRVGVYHHTPESAANLVREVSSDIRAWWNAPKRQDVINEFCHQFARTAKDDKQQWRRKLLELAQ